MLLKEDEKTTITTLDDASLDRLFRGARTHNAWLDRAVSDEQLRALYDLMKWGPTSANTSPARIVFLRDRKSTRLNSSHKHRSRMPSSA